MTSDKDTIVRLKADLRAEQERRAEAERAAPDAQAAERRAAQAERELERIKASVPKDRTEEVQALRRKVKELESREIPPDARPKLAECQHALEQVGTEKADAEALARREKQRADFLAGELDAAQEKAITATADAERHKADAEEANSRAEEAEADAERLQTEAQKREKDIKAMRARLDTDTKAALQRARDEVVRLKEEVRGLQGSLAEERARAMPAMRGHGIEARQENRELRRRIRELATYKEALNGNHQ